MPALRKCTARRRSTPESGMNDSETFVKTALGLDEVRSRALKLPQRLRTMLIMVDGTRTVAQLRQAQLTLGAPGDFLENLLALGLVVSDMAPAKPASGATPPSSQSPPAQAAKAAPAAQAAQAAVDFELSLPALDTGLPQDAEKFRAALKFMNDTSVDLLGLRSFFFTLKVEKCFTMADLKELIPQFSSAIAKSKGAEVARAMEERVQRMIL